MAQGQQITFGIGPPTATNQMLWFFTFGLGAGADAVVAASDSLVNYGGLEPAEKQFARLDTDFSSIELSYQRVEPRTFQPINPDIRRQG